MDALVLLLLAFFPFGQLPGVFAQSILGLDFRMHPVDLIVLFIVVFTLIVIRKKINFRSLYPFAAVLWFGFVVAVLGSGFDIVGLFYLARLAVYLIFGIIVLEYPLRGRDKILPALVVVGVMVAGFGWIQYFVFPDLISLKYAGWDDHYYRLVSTFLDPAFTGIVLALASFSALALWFKTKNRLCLASLGLLMVSVGFTYSRAGFVALVLGLLVLLWENHKRLFLALSMLFLVIVVALPRGPGGEGVKLSRVSSIEQKIENYEQGFAIISSSPLFGVGYNNLCLAKVSLGIDISKQANSCYGLDNSALFLWANAGLLGIIGFAYFISNTYLKVDNKLLKASGAAVLVHAMFTNTLFYPWVIIWLALVASRGTLRGIDKF